MRSRFPAAVPGCRIIYMVLLVAGAARSAEPADELRADTTGFYPIWENTGDVEKAGDVRLGTTGAEVGIAGVAQVGTQPVNFLVRSPNAHLKAALFAQSGWRIAAQAGGFRLLEGASRALFSPMYTPRLDNPDFAVTLVPVSVAASKRLAPWVDLHQALTGLAVVAPGRLQTKVTPGYSVVAEFNARSRHALSLHLAEVGLWAHEMSIAGASYRYRNGWMEARIGYFYRFTRSGIQGAPLAALGVLL